MNDNESFNPPSAGGDPFSEADLRLVLDSIGEVAAMPGSGVSAAAGLPRLGEQPARSLLRKLFDIEPRGGIPVSVFTVQHGDMIDLTLAFDLDDIIADMRRDISGGISKNRRLVDFLGGLPTEVTERIDAARTDPRAASHFVATAADHLAWALRLRIQDMLLPMMDDGRILSWRGRIPVAASRNFTGAPLVPFATSVQLEVPAQALENLDV